jgi:hypothetical protein
MNNNFIVNSHKHLCEKIIENATDYEVADLNYLMGRRDALFALLTNLVNTYDVPKTFLQFLYNINSETFSEKELEELYEEDVEINLGDHSIRLPFTADLYHNLVHLVEESVKEMY